MDEPRRDAERAWPLHALGVVLAAVVVLRSMGRVWWCRCGSLAPWSLEAHGTHTSQHLVDPYSFTHFLHGVVFCGLLWLALRKFASPRLRFALAVVLEACWELLENSSWVIERYRAETVAQDYYGDSIVNSLGDIACCALGFLVARRLPVWGSVVAFVVIELFLLVAIRDNLTLNVLMLTFPIPAVKAWQARR